MILGHIYIKLEINKRKMIGKSLEDKTKHEVKVKVSKAIKDIDN